MRTAKLACGSFGITDRSANEIVPSNRQKVRSGGPRSKSPIVAKRCHIDEQCENRCRFVASHLVASKSVFW
jgi:hypothetical protein